MNGFRRQSSPISDWVWMPSYIALWALINNPIILLVALALSWGGPRVARILWKGQVFRRIDYVVCVVGQGIFWCFAGLALQQALT